MIITDWWGWAWIGFCWGNGMIGNCGEGLEVVFWDGDLGYFWNVVEFGH